ncbi:MAG: hypothetical protein REI78_04530 [Pedobacter sp.]|nr:hypothetical protein [Pedobacter sp.]
MYTCNFNLALDQTLSEEIYWPASFTISLNEGENEISIPLSFNLPTLQDVASDLVFKLNLVHMSTIDLVTIKSSDYPSADSPHLILRNADGSSAIYHEAAKSNGDRLSDAIVSFLVDATEAIFAELEKKDFMAVIKRPLPQMSQEMMNELRLVYKDGYYFGPYDPTADYDDRFTIHPLGSAFSGLATLDQGTDYANVKGSTNDPHISGYSWLGLWASYYGGAQCCSSLNFHNFQCNNNLVGGHCLLGQHASTVRPGAYDVVFIIPICNAHNNNNNYYMSPVKYRRIIVLKSYLR